MEQEIVTGLEKLIEQGTNGQLKFGTYLFNIIAAHPDKKYSTKDLIPKMEQAIADNKILKVPTKKINDAVGAYLHSYYSLGNASREDIEGKIYYQYKVNTDRKYKKSETKTSGKDLTPAAKKALHNNNQNVDTDRPLLDEKIIEMLSDRYPTAYSSAHIVNDIRMGPGFVEIGASLDGSLSKCVEESIARLILSGDIKRDSDNNYKYC